MKYFLAIMACMMLDIIEPTGCSRDTESYDTAAQTESPAPNTAE